MEQNKNRPSGKKTLHKKVKKKNLNGRRDEDRNHASSLGTAITEQFAELRDYQKRCPIAKTLVYELSKIAMLEIALLLLILEQSRTSLLQQLFGIIYMVYCKQSLLFEESAFLSTTTSINHKQQIQSLLQTGSTYLATIVDMIINCPRLVRNVLENKSGTQPYSYGSIITLVLFFVDNRQSLLLKLVVSFPSHEALNDETVYDADDEMVNERKKVLRGKCKGLVRARHRMTHMYKADSATPVPDDTVHHHPIKNYRAIFFRKTGYSGSDSDSDQENHNTVDRCKLPRELRHLHLVKAELRYDYQQGDTDCDSCDDIIRKTIRENYFQT